MTRMTHHHRADNSVCLSVNQFSPPLNELINKISISPHFFVVTHFWLLARLGESKRNLILIALLSSFSEA